MAVSRDISGISGDKILLSVPDLLTSYWGKCFDPRLGAGIRQNPTD